MGKIRIAKCLKAFLRCSPEELVRWSITMLQSWSTPIWWIPTIQLLKTSEIYLKTHILLSLRLRHLLLLNVKFNVGRYHTVKEIQGGNLQTNSQCQLCSPAPVKGMWMSLTTVRAKLHKIWTSLGFELLHSRMPFGSQVASRTRRARISVKSSSLHPQGW